jgi:hypothetical protein
MLEQQIDMVDKNVVTPHYIWCKRIESWSHASYTPFFEIPREILGTKFIRLLCRFSSISIGEEREGGGERQRRAKRDRALSALLSSVSLCYLT